MYGNTKVIPQVSQAHVASVLCKRVGVALQATVETLYHKQNTEVCGILCLIQNLNGSCNATQTFLWKVNSHNAPVTWAWDTCGYTRALHCLLCGHARWVWPCTVRESGLCHWTRIRKNSWSTRSDLIPKALALYNGFQHISAVFWTIYI